MPGVEACGRSPVPLPTAGFSSQPAAPVHHWKLFQMTGGSVAVFAGTMNSLPQWKIFPGMKDLPANLSGYGKSTEHIQREVRSELLNLPGAIHMNFIFLPENLEVTFLKETIS